MASAKGKSKSKGQVLHQEEVLQALVIADSLDSVRFDPITNETPRALLPLANVPLLNFTLNALKDSGIQEAIVFCSAHSEQIIKYLQDAGWMKCDSMQVITVVMDACISLWNLIHEVDSKNLLKGDFVMLDAFTVTNVNLLPIIKTHRSRVEETSGGAIMTVIAQRRLSHNDQLVLAVNKDRILHYQSVSNAKHFSLPKDVLAQESDVQLRFDLVDCHIAVCSKQVPALFAENYDFSSMDDFIRGVIMNEEILGNTIHLHELKPGEYAADVRDLAQYRTVSRDIVQGRVTPITITTPHTGRYNVHLSHGVELGRGGRLEHVALGRGTKVGDNSVLKGCITGSSCKIGNNVKLQNCYMWDNVTIGDNVVIESSVMCNNVVVLDNVTIMHDSLLSYYVKVGPDVVVDAGTRLTADDQCSDGDELPETQRNFGVNSKAFIYEAATAVDNNSDEEIDDHGSEQSDDSEADLSDVVDEDMTPEANAFTNELYDLLEKVCQGTISGANAIVEINSLKSAYQLNINEVNHLLVKAALAQCLWRKGNEWDDPPDQTVVWYKAIIRVLAKSKSVISNYIRSPESQKHCLLALEDFDTRFTSEGALISRIMMWMYEHEVLTEESVLKWYKSAESSIHTKQEAEKFVKWLEEAEEESESD